MWVWFVLFTYLSNLFLPKLLNLDEYLTLETDWFLWDSNWIYLSSFSNQLMSIQIRDRIHINILCSAKKLQLTHTYRIKNRKLIFLASSIQIWISLMPLSISRATKFIKLNLLMSIFFWVVGPGLVLFRRSRNKIVDQKGGHAGHRPKPTMSEKLRKLAQNPCLLKTKGLRTNACVSWGNYFPEAKY